MALALHFLAALFGAFVTYHLSSTLRQGAVRASSLVGIVVGLLWYLFPSVFALALLQKIPYVIFGGSFIGMVTAERHISRRTLVMAAGIFSLLFSLKSSHFDGLGGLLGITAMLSLVSSVGVLLIWQYTRQNN